MLICLSIVPNWNWNLMASGMSGGNFVSINRTKLELKPDKHFHQYLSKCLSIVPNWNWNKCKHGVCVRTAKLSIVPNWNWNLSCFDRAALAAILSIVPNWNWNNEAQAPRLLWVSAINRTKLELKPMAGAWALSLIRFYQSYQTGIETAPYRPGMLLSITLSIVPNWNWNNAGVRSLSFR